MDLHLRRLHPSAKRRWLRPAPRGPSLERLRAIAQLDQVPQAPSVRVPGGKGDRRRRPLRSLANGNLHRSHHDHRLRQRNAANKDRCPRAARGAPGSGGIPSSSPRARLSQGKAALPAQAETFDYRYTDPHRSVFRFFQSWVRTMLRLALIGLTATLIALATDCQASFLGWLVGISAGGTALSLAAAFTKRLAFYQLLQRQTPGGPPQV